MFVKPAEGLVIRDPDLKDLLPPTGRTVPESDYWVRRVRDGDVIKCSGAAAATPNIVVVEATANNHIEEGDQQ